MIKRLAVLLLLTGCATAKDALTADEHMRLGASYEEQGLRGQASREYGAALRRQPASLAALMALGNLAFQRGELVEAEIYYRQVLRHVPDHAGANNNLAMVFLVRGSRLEVAENHAKTALKQAGPFRPYVLDTLANVYMRAGRLEEARAALDEADQGCGEGESLLRRHLTQSRQKLAAFAGEL